MKSPTDDIALHDQMLDAHARKDGASLVTLYRVAARNAGLRGDTDAAAFFYTHAYVFALEIGGEEAGRFHAKLKALGREE